MGTRSLVISATLFAAGASVSLGLALWCSLFSPMRGSRPLTEVEAESILRGRLGEIEIHSTPGGIRHWGWGFSFVLASDMGEVPTPPRHRPRRSGGRRLTRFNTSSFNAIPGNPHQKTVQVISAGWPMTCLAGERRIRPGSSSMHGVTRPPGPVAGLGVKPQRLLPYRPAWAGLTVNSLFFAGVLWLAVPGPFVLRRYLRRRGGRCAACGYDLRHLEGCTCPECGSAV